MRSEEDRHQCALASFISTVNLLSSYKRISHDRLTRTRTFMENMKPEYRGCLTNYHRLLHTVRAGVNQNFSFLKAIIENMPKTFGSIMWIPTVFEVDQKAQPSQSELQELFLLLRELHREWSAEGGTERNKFFSPLLERAEKLFPGDRKEIRVMVPGQRLGRLVFEFIKRGFSCEGQESSYLKAACACFLLDNEIPEDSFSFHPFLHCLDNNLRDEERTRTVRFPDENPNAILSKNKSCSFVLGDFINAYKNQSNEWDLIVTCFYVHIVPDVIRFLEIVFKCLKPGGHWLNFGSLVSSSHKRKNQVLMTPSYEDVRGIIGEIGFIVLEEQTNIPAAYCGSPSSMRTTEYRNVLLVCRKPLDD